MAALFLCWQQVNQDNQEAWHRKIVPKGLAIFFPAAWGYDP